MRRYLKKFFSQKSVLFICTALLLISIFMANGYAILKAKLNIDGTTSIEPAPETWTPHLSFVQTSQLDNVFYEIIIENDSNLTCYEWELKIKDTGYISFPFGVDAERQGNSWVLNNLIWDDRIEAGGKLTVNITFQVERDLDNSMSIEEYADYFVNHFITISVNTNPSGDKEGKIVKNGNATLILHENEIEVKDFVLEKNKAFTPSLPNETQYILTVYNNSNNNYSKIRANIYLGNSSLLGISPSEIVCEHATSTTFKVPVGISLEKDKAVSVYITIRTEDSTFVPDVVVATFVE